ncbi:MAG: ribosome-binding factor A, partial [Maricaulaceae bacterium]
FARVPGTVPDGRASPDLRHAAVCVAPWGADDPAKTAAALNRCARFLRGRLGPKLTMKFTPDLHFEPDDSFAAASAMNALLNSAEVRRDLSLEPDDDAAERG